MSVVALASARAASGPRLGPATVVDAAPGALRIELENGSQVDALMALAFPYEPARGDVVLSIGEDGRYYVIGVLRGHGRSSLQLPGDVELRADGVLRLAGERGVEIAAPELSLAGEKLQVVADA